ncbi:MAG: hypothetical protein WAN32_01050, partial [Candidatus Acidiferrum sp.]
VAPGAAVRMAALIFANSPCASFGHLAMYSTTPLLLCFVMLAFSSCPGVFSLSSAVLISPATLASAYLTRLVSTT